MLKDSLAPAATGGVMKEKQKGTLAVVAAAGLVLVASMAMVGLAPRPAAAESVIPTAQNGTQMFHDPSFLGVSSTRTTEGSGASSFQAIAGTAGDLLVYAICARGGTLGGYSVLFDSDIATGLDVHTRSNIFGKAITVGNPASDVSGIAQSNLGGCYVPPWPRLFTKGLVIVQSATTHFTEVLYRLNDGRNP